jgi:hypothetical protein
MTPTEIGKAWRKCNQLQPNPENLVCKLLKMVARDGIEPPTPAFSGLLTDSAKWFEINANACRRRSYERSPLGSIGMIWAVFASSMFPYCSHAVSGGPPAHLRRGLPLDRRCGVYAGNRHLPSDLAGVGEFH